MMGPFLAGSSFRVLSHHPYISHIYNSGDWLLGGEIELLQKVTHKPETHTHTQGEHMVENTITRQRMEMVRPMLEHMLDAPSHPGVGVGVWVGVCV